MKIDSYGLEYTTILQAKTEEKPNVVVKIVCRIQELREPEQKETEKGFKAVSTAKLSDQEGNTIETVDFNKKTYAKLVEFQRQGVEIIIVAVIQKEEKKNGNYLNKLKIKKSKKVTSLLDVLRATPAEIAHVKAIIAEGVRKGEEVFFWFFKAIRQAVIQLVGIVGKDLDDAFNDAIDAMILQAFSWGMLNNTNGKIHTCIIGPPASGKKLLWRIATILNPIQQEAQATRTTPAGLTAVINQRNGTWTQTPGKIPLANKGVFGIQDFDKRKDKTELFSILGDVMEDGKCVISGAARATLEANTAIHLDLNRQSDLTLADNKLVNVLEDIQMPSNVLSRLDFVVELEKDYETQTHAALAMLSSGTTPKNHKGYILKYANEHGLNPERLLKLVVAKVTTDFANVDQSKASKYKQHKYGEISILNDSNAEAMSKISPFNTRMANTVMKFVAAITRIQLSVESNDYAVDMAFQLLSRKLDFLKNINRSYEVPGYRGTGKAAFGRWLTEVCRDDIFSVKDVEGYYKGVESPCGECSPRTFRDWVSVFAKRIRNGQWKIKSKYLKAYSDMVR